MAAPWRHLASAISRRTLLRGLAATSAAAAAVAVLPGCANDASTQGGTPTVVQSDEAADYVIDPATNESLFSAADLALAEKASYTIDLGNVLHPAEGTWLPVTTAGSSATPMVKGSALSVETGQLSEVVAAPMAADQNNTVIYDVRCSDAAYAWVELDLLTRAWTLYGARFSNGALVGEPSVLWQADADWDPARFAVTGSSVIWQVMPAVGGAKTTEHSFCYLWKTGDQNAHAVVESPGRFATEPAVSEGTVTLSPRVNADKGTFYGMTAYSLSDDLATQVARLVLPASVRPLNAVYMQGLFAFSIEANYGSGGLLGNMGTYLGDGTGKFVTLSREPAAAVCGRGGTFVIKSRASYFVVNTNERSYSVLTAANHCIDYGEYPARLGTCESFVTFSTIKDQLTGYPTSVSVRVFGF